MVSSSFYQAMNFIAVAIFVVHVTVTSASQCLCDERTVKEKFCSLQYSFRGKILAINEVEVPAERVRRAANDEASSYSFELPDYETIQNQPQALTTKLVFEYQVEIEQIYKGVDLKYLMQVVPIRRDSDEIVCGTHELLKDKTYLFQVKDFTHLDVCEAVIRFKDVVREDRFGLKKHYRHVCKPEQKRSLEWIKDYLS